MTLTDQSGYVSMLIAVTVSLVSLVAIGQAVSANVRMRSNAVTREKLAETAAKQLEVMLNKPWAETVTGSTRSTLISWTVENISLRIKKITVSVDEKAVTARQAGITLSYVGYKYDDF